MGSDLLKRRVFVITYRQRFHPLGHHQRQGFAWFVYRGRTVAGVPDRDAGARPVGTWHGVRRDAADPGRCADFAPAAATAGAAGLANV